MNARLAAKRRPRIFAPGRRRDRIDRIDAVGFKLACRRPAMQGRGRMTRSDIDACGWRPWPELRPASALGRAAVMGWIAWACLAPGAFAQDAAAVAAGENALDNGG